MRNYKLSTFNNKINIDEKFTLFYNSFSGKLVVINTKIRTKEELECLACSNSLLRRQLLDSGIFIPKEIDEEKELELRILKGMENTDEYILHINPTLDCNFHCWYCYEKHISHSQMSFSTLRKVLKFISGVINDTRIKKIYLGFFGGEPLLCFNNVVKEIIKYSSTECKRNDKKLYVSFTTNGYLLNEEMIQWLSQFNCGFQITLDGGKTAHNFTRVLKNGEGSYDQIIHNIHDLVKNKINVVVRINFTRKNIESVESIFKSFQDVKTEYKKFISFDFQRVWQDRDKTYDQTEKKASEIRQFFKDNGFNVQTNYLPQDVRYPCYGDKINYALINYNGDVFGCTARDFTKDQRIGVLLKSGIIDYDKEKLSLKRMSKYSKPVCRTCRIAPICGGGCTQKTYEARETDTCHYDYSEEDKDNIVINLLHSFISKL